MDEINYKKYYTFFLVMSILHLVACGKTDEDKSKFNLDKGVVKILIEGDKFNIPLRYMYGEAIEKRGEWPTPKKERVKVGAINLSLILPELKPYYLEDENLWKLPGHGVQVRVGLMKPVGSPSWHAWLIEYVNKRTLAGEYIKKNNIYGLHHYIEKIGDRYFPLDGLKLTITCNKQGEVKYPSCKTKSNYRKGLVLEYYYGIEHLSDWKMIDHNLKKCLMGFCCNNLKI